MLKRPSVYDLLNFYITKLKATTPVTICCEIIKTIDGRG